MASEPAGISIHALRKESDLGVGVLGYPEIISIHALRKESDFSGWLRRGRRSYFNPRSP